jgi:chromosome segregation ATPase
MPYLAFNLNDVNEFVFDILEERLSIGRDAKNDIVIDNTYISGSHAEFLRKPDGVYELVDLKSANGTFVNGRRIQRSLVKGGDKIRFGQLDARFREQAPKGTAPASGSKPSSQPKASPAHSDGRRGDTEPKRDTSPIEPARSFQTLREGAAAAAPSAGSLSIAIPSSATLDLALLKQREKLAAEVRRLRQERDLLRSETENQIRLREEVRAMESSLDERRKEAQAADARLAETRAATMEYANRYSIINSAADARLAETRAAIATAQAEAEKLASKKRDVADLDSQIESKRTQLSKVQADIETANTAFQSLHTDADKARNDRLEAEKQLADLHTQIQQHEAKSSELEAIFNTAQKQKQSDLATLEAKLQANQAEKEQLDKTLAELSQPNQQLQAQATDLTNKQDDLAGTDVKLGEANTALKAVESNEAELTAAISQMVVKRDSLAREILSSTEKSRAQNTLLQTLTVRRGAVDAEVRSSEEQQASLSAEISKARESLRATETTLETRKQELATAESRAAQFTQQAEESVRQQTQIQQEIAQVRGELVKEQAELQQIRTDTQNAMTAAEEAEAAHARHSSQAVAMQTQISGLETLLATLLTSQTDRQTNLVALEAEQRRCEDGLNLRELEVSKADARLAELKAQTANYESRLSELASMEKNLAETKAAWIAAGQEQESLKIEAERLQRERADHEKRLLDLQTELVNAQSELKTQLIELETSQASAKEVAERVSALEAHEAQLLEAEKRLEEVRRDITLQMTERDGVSALVLTLFSQRAEHENLLPKLRADVQVLKTELQTLTQDKNSIMVALERVQADRHAALEQTESLLAESANLQERLTEKRDTLEAEIKARLAETNQAEARLIEITAKVAASEKRVSDLAVAQEQLTECQNALKETEVRRHAEEKALAELVKQQDRLRNELFTLEDGIRAGTGAVNDLTTKIKS